MKKLTIISGKGGTGKTTITANFAALAEHHVLADCDVDAPNMHLLMNPEIKESHVFKAGKLVVKDEQKCTDCGLCLEYCRFNAVNLDFSINPIKCEGCGVCAEVCPEDALKLKKVETGKIYNSQTRFGPMIHAKLKAGAENSGKLVSEVRERAEDLAEEFNKGLVLIDGAPGIGCPVIASLNGVDAALIVTEPTKSGLSNLKRVLDMTSYFSINSMVLINKCDLNLNVTDKIEDFCLEKEIPVVGQIPFNSDFVQLLRQGNLMVESDNQKIVYQIKNTWQKVHDNF